MGVWGHLLATPYGRAALIGFAVMLGIGAFFIWYFLRKISQDQATHDAKK